MSVPHKQPFTKFKVAKGTVLLDGGKSIKQGEYVTSDMMKEEQLVTLLRNRVIVTENAPIPEYKTEDEAIPVIVKPNGTVVSKPVVETPPASASIEVSVGAVKTTTTPAAVAKVDNGEVITQGRWNHNPVLLQAKPIDELNAMVIEIDAAVAPFTTKEEAITWLSQDYKG